MRATSSRNSSRSRWRRLQGAGKDSKRARRSACRRRPGRRPPDRRGSTSSAHLSRGIHPADPHRGRASARAQSAEAGAPAVRVKPGHVLSFDCRSPDQVEVAAYWTPSQRPSTNALKHANAARVWVSLRVEDDMPLLSVRDDGAGAADATRGSALTGLRDRIEALGRADQHREPARSRNPHRGGELRLRGQLTETTSRTSTCPPGTDVGLGAAPHCRPPRPFPPQPHAGAPGSGRPNPKPASTARQTLRGPLTPPRAVSDPRACAALPAGRLGSGLTQPMRGAVTAA